MLKKIFILFCFLLLLGLGLKSANRYWIGNGTNVLWKNKANWSTTSGGAGGATIPSSADIAIFNGSGTGNCSIDTATVNIAGIQVNSGYTGTITRAAANTTFTVGTSNAVFSSGTFNGGSTAMTINGTFTLSGGTFVSTTNSLTLASSVTYSSGVFTHNGGAIVLSSSSAVTIPLWTFNSLTSSGSGSRTFQAGTTRIASVFTTGTNAYTVSTGSRVEFSGAAQNIPALPSSVAYKRLICGGTGNKTATGALIVNDSLIINASRTLAMSTFMLSGNFVTGGTGNLTTACTIAPPSGIPIPESKTWSFTTVSYNSSSAQVIVPGNYLSLNGSGGARTLRNSGTIQISGTFTPGTGTYVITGSTINYNHNNSQSIAAFNYENLTISGARGIKNVTFPSTGEVAISAVFTNSATFTTGGFVTTGSTVNYNGSGAQQVIPFNYNNLIISGSRGSNNVTFSTVGTIKVAKIFSPFAIFTTGKYIATNTSFEFNGTLPQRIPAFNYNNLVSSSTGERAFSSSDTVKISGNITKGTNTYVNYGNLGDSYTPLNSGVKTNIFGCDIVNSSTIYVVGVGGMIRKSTDGGINWTSQTSGTTIDLFSVYFVGSDTGVVVGNSGIVRRTVNGGTTWTAVSSGISNDLRYVCNLNSSTVFFTGGSGVIRKSVNGGTAAAVTSGTTQSLYGMCFTSSTVGYACGAAGTIVKTTDGGLNWSTTGIVTGTTENLFSIKFISTTTGFAVGNNGKIIKTTDSGATWSNVTSGTANILNTIDFVSSNLGFIYGGEATNNTGQILKTIDGGATWSVINTGTARLYCGNMLNSSVGYAVGIDGVLIKYSCCSDGGTIEFNGTANQYINGGSTTVKCNKININKSNGKLYLNAPLEIQKRLTLTKGILVSSVTNTLQFIDGVDTIAANDTNYVAGPIKKTGNDVFTFPLGDTTITTGSYHPLKISAPAVLTDAYTACYFAQNQTYGPGLQPDSLAAISNCEYFTLNRDAGTSIVTPTISWNSNSCNVDNYNDLRVAYWDGTASQWKSMGASNIIVDGNRGYISGVNGVNATLLPMTLAKFKTGNETYAILKRQLDGGFFIVNNGKLTFKYDEEYNDSDNKLTFNIYNDIHNVVATNLNMPVGLQPTVVYGDNRYLINTLNCNLSPLGRLGVGYYTLEVINEKGEKRYLRFKNVYNIMLLACPLIGLGE